MKVLSFLGVLFCATTVQGQQLLYSPNIPIQEIRISPKHASGGLVQHNISDLQYLPISADKKADLIDYINAVQISNGTIAVLSNGNAKVSLMDNAGKITNTLKSTDFKLPQIEPLQTLTPSSGGFILGLVHFAVKLNNQGQHKVIDLPAATNTANDSLTLNNTVWSFWQPKEKSSDLTALQYNGQAVITYHKLSPYAISRDLDRNLSQPDMRHHSAFANFPNNYELFELGEQGIQKVYKFIFPKDISVDTALLYNIKDQIGFDKFMMENKEKLFGFNQILSYKDYLLLQLITYGGDRSWIAVNTNNQEVLAIKNIMPDASNDYLPIIGWNDYLLSDGEYLYSILYPNETGSAHNKSDEENHTMKKGHANLIKSKNPILVKFKLNSF